MRGSIWPGSTRTSLSWMCRKILSPKQREEDLANPLNQGYNRSMTDEELKNLVAQLVQSQQKTDLEMLETTQRMRESAQRMRESKEETDKQLRELGKQIGGLGQKFGSFTEGMAYPSMQKLLRNRFKMELISPRVVKRKADKWIELDVMAYANTHVNEVYIVEVKSHLRKEGLEQTKKILEQFYEFFPEHKDKKVYGIIAAVDVSEKLKQEVLNEGIYLARIHEDQFELDVTEDFVAKAA